MGHQSESLQSGWGNPCLDTLQGFSLIVTSETVLPQARGNEVITGYNRQLERHKLVETL